MMVQTILVNPGVLISNINKILDQDIPKLVDKSFIEKLGLDLYDPHREISTYVRLFKEMGLIDASGRPTDIYKKAHNIESRDEVMSKCIRNAYSDVFEDYPNILYSNPKDNTRKNILSNYYPTNSESTIARKTTVFNHLCNGFHVKKYFPYDDSIEIPTKEEIDQGHKEKVQIKKKDTKSPESGITVEEIRKIINLIKTGDEPVEKKYENILKDHGLMILMAPDGTKMLAKGTTIINTNLDDNWLEAYLIKMAIDDENK